MGQPANDDPNSPERKCGDDDIGMKSVAPQDTMSEKQDAEKDVENGRRARSAHIDAAVAARIADNVEDFMVIILYSLGGLWGKEMRKRGCFAVFWC